MLDDGGGSCGLQMMMAEKCKWGEQTNKLCSILGIRGKMWQMWWMVLMMEQDPTVGCRCFGSYEGLAEEWAFEVEGPIQDEADGSVELKKNELVQTGWRQHTTRKHLSQLDAVIPIIDVFGPNTQYISNQLTFNSNWWSPLASRKPQFTLISENFVYN